MSPMYRSQWVRLLLAYSLLISHFSFQLWKMTRRRPTSRQTDSKQRRSAEYPIWNNNREREYKMLHLYRAPSIGSTKCKQHGLGSVKTALAMRVRLAQKQHATSRLYPGPYEEEATNPQLHMASDWIQASTRVTRVDIGKCPSCFSMV